MIEAYFARHADALALAGAPLVLPGGEHVKNDPAHAEAIRRAVNDTGLDRHSYLAVIGGGALLDVGGFAAATAHRGIRLLRIPTTTLSQNDSGVGVKNGINAFGKKNFTGTFAPAWAVFNDLRFLETLPDREWRAGIAEAVKVALIKDAAFFDYIEGVAPALAARDLPAMGQLIHRCARLHVAHICQGGDPFEMGSSRPLDFGHWSAHKLEQLTHYRLRHGEAVAIGLALDATYSHLQGWLSAEDCRRVTDVLAAVGFALYDPALESPESVPRVARIPRASRRRTDHPDVARRRRGFQRPRDRRRPHARGDHSLALGRAWGELRCPRRGRRGARYSSFGLMNPQASGLATLLPLFRELNNLKRIHASGKTGSWAERAFVRAWARLVAGEDCRALALQETARAVAATLLAGIDAEVLAGGGVPQAARREIFARAFDAASAPLAPDFAAALRETLDPEPSADPPPGRVPTFVPLLAGQPRAGATRPGHPRVVLEPAENHAEHCAVVAFNGVLAASVFGADPAVPFLTGLCHHLHNARLPDAGDAGDVLLGEHLRPLMETFRAAALDELPPALRGSARDSLQAVYRTDYPEARAFQAADSLDRVLEMEWHARSAAFTLDVALGDMDIIHPGPVQAFQLEVMRAVGWK